MYFLQILTIAFVFAGLAETYPLSPLHKSGKDVGDDDVFMVNIFRTYFEMYACERILNVVVSRH